jgi:hypothetical protein
MQGADRTLHRTINSDTFDGVTGGHLENHPIKFKSNHANELNTTSLLKILSH